MKRLKHLLKAIAPFVLIAVICICLTPHPVENDTYYLVKIGDYIWNHGIDFKDHYSWFADLAYTYPHFLFNLICFAFYSVFNWPGLYLLSMSLYTLFGFSMFTCLRSDLRNLLKKNSHLAPSTQTFLSTLPLVLTILSVALLSPFVAARSQILTYTAFVWEIHSLTRLITTHNKKYLYALVFLSWLVAITHATIWPFVFILYLPFFAELLLQEKAKYSNVSKNHALLTSLTSKFEPLKAPKKGTFKLLFFAFLFSLFVGLLTPAQICYTAIFKIMQGPSQGYIIEHAPLVLVNNPGVVCFLIVFLAIVIFTKAKFKQHDFFLLLGLTILPFISVRHSAFLFTIAFLPLFHLIFNWATYANPSFFEAVNKFTPIRLIVATCLILAILNFVEQLRKPILDEFFTPIEAVAFLKTYYPELDDLDLNSTRAVDIESPVRLINEYNTGAYLLEENIPVFIDSRANIYTKPFSNNLESDLFSDYVEILDGSEKSFELIKQYRLTTFFLYKTTNLARVLARDPAYNEIYSDDQFVIFENPSAFASE